MNREDLYMKIIRQLIMSNWTHTEYGPTINFGIWRIFLNDFDPDISIKKITDRFIAEIFDKMDPSEEDEGPESGVFAY